jgi:poly(A) polymerase
MTAQHCDVIPQRTAVQQLQLVQRFTSVTNSSLHSLTLPLLHNAHNNRLVPNYESFLPVVRFVRLWAKRRGIYGNKWGYLGGVNCNILVAFVCQLYPKASPSKLLASFFKVMKTWGWPNAVHLVKPFDAGLNLDVWQPVNNAWHVMPIITPAYPGMNSSVSVNAQSLAVMVSELTRGDALCRDILDNKGGTGWDAVVRPSEFFAKYSHYLAVDIMAAGESEFRGWKGFMESRIRKLVEFIAAQPQTRTAVLRLHLHPRPFDACCSGGVNGELPAHCVCYFVGFDVDKARVPGKKRLDLGPAFQRFEEMGMRTDWHKEGMNLAVTTYSFKTLPAFVFDTLGGRDAAREIRAGMKREQEAARKARLAAVAAAAPQVQRPSVVAAAAAAAAAEAAATAATAAAAVKDESSAAAAAAAADHEQEGEYYDEEYEEAEGGHWDPDADTKTEPKTELIAAAAAQGRVRKRPAQRDFFVLEPVVPKWRQQALELACRSAASGSAEAASKRIRIQLLPHPH